MKYVLICFTLMTWSASIRAQTAEESVKAVINQLFQGMKLADSSLLKASFADHAILQTVETAADGTISIRDESIHSFIESIAKLPRDAADERIRFDMVKADGALATAWTPYQFYFKGKFSHCGVDSYQLVRLQGGWKIQYLIDTRRKDGCL